jgi:hypothetical protein
LSKIRKTPNALQTQLFGVKKTKNSKLLGKKRKKYKTRDSRNKIINGTLFKPMAKYLLYHENSIYVCAVPGRAL